MLGASLFIGAALAFLSSRIPLKPINNLINQMNRLAAGDFKARLAFGNVLSSHPAFREITASFNTMAQELDQTELLRSDFINNFSHEFKTPIVSIAGFARLLSKADLTEEQRRLYLAAIEEESLRLSAMATNVLMLTRIENQTILTDETSFNLSEQIRSSLLLFEKEWTRKSLLLSIDLAEYTVTANEELLKEVWVNLIDNAVKFTPEGGEIVFSAQVESGRLSVTVSNTGSEIPEEKRDKIFRKFYQTDESHATKGNGVGLAIVKRIVELHRGTVSVTSGEGKTAFTVTLPYKEK